MYLIVHLKMDIGIEKMCMVCVNIVIKERVPALNTFINERAGMKVRKSICKLKKLENIRKMKKNKEENNKRRFN